MQKLIVFSFLLWVVGCVAEPSLPEVSQVQSEDDGSTVIGTDSRTTDQSALALAETETHELFSGSFLGKVVRVLDGDTVEVLTDEMETIRIQLNGIDCPEEHQPFGDNAREYISRTIYEKTVRYVKQDVDQYGRTIADVYLPADVAYAGQNPAGVNLPDMFINRELVRRGLAWHYKQYSDDERLADDERQARTEKLGLWSDPLSVPPWDWRQMSDEERKNLR